jgi:ABC-type Fe3+-siderophore transport system permease subunit
MPPPHGLTRKKTVSDDVTLSTYSYSFVFLYFFLSIIVFVGLHRLKKKANNEKSYFFFVTVTIANLFSSIIQGLVFNYDSEMLDPILNIKSQDYDNVWYASIIFAPIYLSQLPENLYYKGKSKKNDRNGKYIT